MSDTSTMTEKARRQWTHLLCAGCLLRSNHKRYAEQQHQLRYRNEFEARSAASLREGQWALSSQQGSRGECIIAPIVRLDCPFPHVALRGASVAAQDDWLLRRRAVAPLQARAQRIRLE